MTLDKFHLTKKDDEWRLEKAGSNRAIAKADTKAEAIKKMQKYFEKNEGSVRIHKEDGKIQEERTYPRSKDPKGSKG